MNGQNQQGKMTTYSKGRKGSVGSIQTNRDLNNLSHHELVELYTKTKAILNNSGIKLPDGGSKLKAKLEQIEEALKNTENTSLSKRVSELSINDRPNTRKEVLIHANKSASSQENQQSHKLLRSHSDMVSSARSARIISLDESIQLQESQQKEIKEANMKKRMESVKKSIKTDSLTDELTSTMGRLRLDPETRIPRPDDDGPSDDEGPDADSIDDTDDDDELFYGDEDDEGFDEEDEAAEQQRQRRS
ncbi:uncharacterized protein RHIMIDRAFT_130931 [Rhizopus microsporus ATCC 52813]|uniref:Uncharacterized protein n=1 Tax=Rhizopus microsporus ATCC 52813 TaxID=1340429 RepID=A0A2G4SWY8_RHIZD|nr:uncharacterized protein RHIMIDRAFT_130931 [Rhizopus microsporus ATCC 52813]PHZ13262.1 hypothetical protein RHIMIDRAFT_130931 [Rhizopus microsporus ATCC 52813]